MYFLCIINLYLNKRSAVLINNPNPDSPIALNYALVGEIKVIYFIYFYFNCLDLHIHIYM